MMLAKKTGLGLALILIALLGFLLVDPIDRPVRSATSNFTQESESTLASQHPTADTSWEHFGGDLRGQKYSPLTQINRGNVRNLRPAWEFSTGTLEKYRQHPKYQAKALAFEATPILFDRTLFLCDPLNVVFALDAKTGRQIWRFDPEVGGKVAYDHLCRGVATWHESQQSDSATCRKRIFVGTTDARLIALDSKSGTLCSDFGRNGTLDLTEGMGDLHPGEYYMTSPPTVVNDLVITGALVADNWRKDAPSGVVRAFNARTGALVWAWDATPPGYNRPAGETGTWTRGTPNAWALFSADPERDMIFIPTGNPALDLFGGERQNLDYYGSSVAALRASTGEYLWHFQTVHHDLWDYDVAAQPTLFNFKRGNEIIPAIAQATKVGHLFLLDRRTGKPLFPVVENPVPQTQVRDEKSASTQPFPTQPPPLYPYDLMDPNKTKAALSGPLCLGYEKKKFRCDGVFTPPSFQGSITFPGPIGGTEWGGVAIDEENQILVLNQSHMPIVNKLVVRRRDQAPLPEIGGDSVGDFDMTGAPYYASRQTLTNFMGIPCLPAPSGELIAVNLKDGSIRWRVPLGQTVRIIKGSLNVGGPLITGGGLVFIGATLDNSLLHKKGYLRAFDLKTGELVWKTAIPTQASANPMTYMFDGQQYVAIYAGGHGVMKAKNDDRLVVFRLSGP